MDRYEGIDCSFLRGKELQFYIELMYGPLAEVFQYGKGEICYGTGRPYYYGNDEDRDLLPDELTTARGVEVLSQSHDKPFFLALGFMKPHTPLNVPSKYFDMYPPQSLELPPLLENDLADCARALVEHRPYGFLAYGLLMKGGEPLWRHWLQSYLACVTFIDDLIGDLLDALDKSPYRDNTVIVFTSDNGYHMGEKEYLYKDSLWEESGQIPLIISAPGVGREGGVCSVPVSLIDLYPTLIDFCGLPQNPHAATHGFAPQGYSLRPFLQNPETTIWPGPPVAFMSVRGDTGVHHSVRSATHRYTLCQNGEEELYDHQNDPYEWHNLAGNKRAADVKAELREQLKKILWCNAG
jgi:arylsulfatase A-like enzyme